jgi:hypothetical protein
MFLKTKKNKQVSKFSLAVISADFYHLCWLLSHILKFLTTSTSSVLTAITIYIDHFHLPWLLPDIQVLPYQHFWHHSSVLTAIVSSLLTATTYPDRFYYIFVLTGTSNADRLHLSCWRLWSFLTTYPDNPTCPDFYHLRYPDSFLLSRTSQFPPFLAATIYLGRFHLRRLLLPILTASICSDCYYLFWPFPSVYHLPSILTTSLILTATTSSDLLFLSRLSHSVLAATTILILRSQLPYPLSVRFHPSWLHLFVLSATIHALTEPVYPSSNFFLSTVFNSQFFLLHYSDSSSSLLYPLKQQECIEFLKLDWLLPVWIRLNSRMHPHSTLIPIPGYWYNVTN